MRRLALLLVALAALLLVPVAAQAAAPRADFNALEAELMCVTCNVPLNIAGDAPSAVRERERVHELVAQGLTADQVKDTMVDELGRGVLADPPRDGFDATSWLVPTLVLLGLLGGGVALLRATRRRPGGGGPPGLAMAGPAPLHPDDARRLDDDLARYDP